MPTLTSTLASCSGSAATGAGAEVPFRRADERGHAGGAFNLGVLLSRRGDEAGAEAAYRDQETSPSTMRPKVTV